MKIIHNSILLAKQCQLTIAFPENGKIRSRKVVTRSRARATGKFPSMKMMRAMQWESPNELNAFRLLEANPEVTHFQEQPCVLQFILNGEIRRHYPDILVVTRETKEFWEVKPEEEASRPEVVERTALLTKVLPALGYQYRVVLGEDLAKRPRIENVNYLLDYGRKEITPIIREQVRLLFNLSKHQRWRDVIKAENGKINRDHLCRLILDGDIHIDIDQKISDATVLSWREVPLSETGRRSGK